MATEKALYVGTCTPGEMDWQVKVYQGNTGRKLHPRNALLNHSPDGFAWGYEGSGPAQLALAILAHHLKPFRNGDQLAIRYHQDFKRAVIARFPKDEGFELTSEQVSAALRDMLGDPTELQR